VRHHRDHAQNTLSVSAVLAVDPELVVAQVEAVVADFAVAAAKTGMLARPETVVRVAELARRGVLPTSSSIRCWSPRRARA